MPAKINLIGQTFGKLTVIEETNERKNKSVVWKCRCDCGNECYFSTKELRNDGIIQCKQCGTNRIITVNRRENPIGKTYNALTVIEATDKRSGGKIIYKCKCQCGNIVYTNITDLKRGHTKSCGCQRTKYQVGDIINNREIIEKIGFDENKTKGNFYYKCKCLLCGNIYNSLAQSLDKSISCGCQNSIGEYNIIQLLNKNNIQFHKEFCLPHSKLRFDFALIKNNQVYRLIEFDGEQHYQDQVKESGWNVYEQYEQTFKNDMLKNKLAKENNIPLVRIPYWERDNITLDLLLGNKYLIS